MKNIRKILIIDDNPEDQIVYQRYLKKAFSDIHILIKSTGNDALSFLLKSEIDCILLDYRLPDMSGIDFLERLIAKLSPLPPIIMLTGQGSEKIAVDALKLGISDYFVKNELDSEILSKAIINAIEKSELNKKIQAQESEIKFMAYHDYLTGISNRVQFDQLAKKSLSRANRNNKNMAILIIDLDRFKNVNDSLGHQIGDLLLQGVAKRFLAVLREEDTLARLGGDEFAIIADSIEKPDDAEIIARKLLSALEEPFFLKNHSITVSASIGIAEYPDAGDTVSILTRNADAALYKAKETGKNKFCYFTKKLNTEAMKNLYIENFLREALIKKKFLLVYQPIFNLLDSTLYGVEALLRWENYDYEQMNNDQVIPIAENSGLIVPIGYWVIEAAFNQYIKWKKEKGKEIKIAINLSPIQLSQHDFIFQIKELIQKLNINSNSIVFELTETAIVKDLELVAGALNKLNELGCKIYIDDFGTGYSGLSLIRKLPISGLKIDKSFVQNMHNDPKEEKLVKLIFLLAEHLNFIIVSEGLETEKQLELIRSYSPEQKGQGYYLAYPMSVEEIDKLLDKH